MAMDDEGEPCPACGGTGRVKVTKVWGGKTWCAMCDGTGEVDPEVAQEWEDDALEARGDEDDDDGR